MQYNMTLELQYMLLEQAWCSLTQTEELEKKRQCNGSAWFGKGLDDKNSFILLGILRWIIVAASTDSEGPTCNAVQRGP